MKMRDLLVMMTMVTSPDDEVTVELLEGMTAIVRGENPFDTVAGVRIVRDGIPYYREDAVAQLAESLGVETLAWCKNHDAFHAVADTDHLYASLVSTLTKKGVFIERHMGKFKVTLPTRYDNALQNAVEAAGGVVTTGEDGTPTIAFGAQLHLQRDGKDIVVTKDGKPYGRVVPRDPCYDLLSKIYLDTLPAPAKA